MDMGHGDEIVFADANFPSVSHASNRLIQCCGYPLLSVLQPVLQLFPLDYAVDFSGILMQPPPSVPKPPEIWEEFRELLAKEQDGDKPFLYLKKPEFYSRSREAYVIVTTGERRPFSNIILRKGIITGG
jgi:L-fucose mutarotase